MAAEIGVTAAVVGIAGISIKGLIDEGNTLLKGLKDVGNNFKESCESLSKNLEMLLQLVLDYRILEENKVITFQTIENGKPTFTSVGHAVNDLSRLIKEADRYLIKVDEKPKIKQILTAKQIKGKFERLSDDLAKALGRLNSAIQANEVMERCKTQQNLQETKEEVFWQSQLLKSGAVKSAESTPKEISDKFNLKECQDQLHDFYFGSEMKIPLLPWEPDHTAEMETLFVNLELMKDEKSPSQSKQIPLERNEDLVQLPSTEGRQIKRILVQGDAGSGKSTLLDNMTYRWALQSKHDSDSPLSKFDLVFKINMHQICDKTSSLEDVIFNQILEETTEVTLDGLKSFIKSNAEKVLFLVDGIDEDNAGILKSEASDLSKMIYNKTLLKKSCLIATTRPLKLAKMSASLGHFTKIQLTGLSDSNIKLYIQKYFTDTSESQPRGAELVEKLNTRPNLWDLARLPLLLLFFCLLWGDPNETKRCLPNTKAQLYLKTVKSLWKRYFYVKKDKSIDDLDNEEWQLKLTEFLISLGQTSSARFFKQSEDKVLFGEGDFPEEVRNLGLAIGILNRVKIRSKVSLKTFIKFVHASFLDFFYAVYITSLKTENSVESVECKKHIEKLICTPNYIWYKTDLFDKHFPGNNDVLEFCVCHDHQMMKLVVEQWVTNSDKAQNQHGGKCEYVEDDYANPQMEVVSMFILNQQNYLGSVTMFSMLNPLLKLALCAQLNYQECEELVQILSRSIGPCIAWEPDTTDVYVQYQLDLVKQFSNTNQGLFLSTLKMISFDGPIDLNKLLPLFLSTLRCTKLLEVLEIIFQFDLLEHQISDLPQLFEVLCGLTNMKLLSIRRHVNKDSIGIVDITKDLPKLSKLNLKVLRLFNVTCATSTLGEFIWSSRSLKMFAFLNRFREGPVTEIQSSFRTTRVFSNMQNLSKLLLYSIQVGRAVEFLKPILPELQMLALNHAWIDIWDLHELASYLPTAKKLITLDLSRNLIGSAIYNLSDQLKHMISLKNIILDDTGLETVHTLSLVHGIYTMSSLELLSLDSNRHLGILGLRTLKHLLTIPGFQHLLIYTDPFKTPLQTPFQVLVSDIPEMPDCIQCMSHLYNVQCPQCNL